MRANFGFKKKKLCNVFLINRILLKFAVASSTILILLVSYNCKSMRYRQSTDYPDDTIDHRQSNRKAQVSPLTYEEKKKWENEILRIQKNGDPESFEYNLLIAHCFRLLERHEHAAKYYQKAAKLAKQEKTRKEIEKEIVKSYGYAGHAEELKGNYSRSLFYYKECNRFCKIFGFKYHIPIEKINHLKLKAKDEKNKKK